MEVLKCTLCIIVQLRRVTCIELSRKVEKWAAIILEGDVVDRHVPRDITVSRFTAGKRLNTLLCKIARSSAKVG